MNVHLDTTSAVPPYRQLRDQTATMIAAGTLPEGHRLPPIRQLAADLGLAPGTVARAYRELEAAGWVVSAGRRGTRVAPASQRPVADADDVAARLQDAADAYATTASQLGVDPERAVDVLRRRLAAHRSPATD